MLSRPAGRFAREPVAGHAASAVPAEPVDHDEMLKSTSARQRRPSPSSIDSRHVAAHRGAERGAAAHRLHHPAVERPRRQLAGAPVPAAGTIAAARRPGGPAGNSGAGGLAATRSPWQRPSPAGRLPIRRRRSGQGQGQGQGQGHGRGQGGGFRSGQQPRQAAAAENGLDRAFPHSPLSSPRLAVFECPPSRGGIMPRFLVSSFALFACCQLSHSLRGSHARQHRRDRRCV